MKVCKKCKKHVANKMRICKFCGADVSKAKIIKTNNNKKKPVANVKPKSELKKAEQKLENISNISNNETKQNNNKNHKKTLNKEKPKKIIKTNKKQKEKIKKKPKQSISKKERIKKITKIPKKVLNSVKKIYNSVKKVLKFIKHTINSVIKRNSKRKIKVTIISILIIGILLTTTYYGIQIYKNYTNRDNTVIIGEKATNKKIFAMGELITYGGVDYKVVKVETSEGNNYKKPKDGNQFLIVTVYIKNNTSEKIKYSYENWTMSNSEGEDKKRIFTSINVDTALYSGELVIGGIKTGSMVFEQPIEDQKLRLNFYELKKDKQGNEIINEDKKVFSVSIKIPEEEPKESANNDLQKQKTSPSTSKND